MRLLIALMVIVTVESKKKRPTNANLNTEHASPIDRSKVDVYPEYFRQPVPFGHIFRNGMGDPKLDLKQPIDFLELDMQLPKDVENAKEILRKDRLNVQKIRKEPMTFGSPKDEYLYKEDQKRKGKRQKAELEKKNNTKFWFDWSSIHERNSAKRRTNPYLKKIKYKGTQITSSTEPVELRKQYFAVNSFDLDSNRKEYFGNWSTCDDYRKAINFHPKDIINIDWVPFYVWSTRKYHTANVHRFSYPTKKLVKQYKEDFSPYLNKSVDWDQPKLVLKEVLELLLIAKDRIGLFNAIPHHEIPSSMKNKAIHIPTLSMRLKIVDPYLAIIYCENQFATIMAVSGNEPLTDEEKVLEAKTLKFRGRGFPVYRNLEMEKMRAQAEIMWNAEREESKFLTVTEPIVRNHFLERDHL